jgi:enoyl-CoA hydratase
VGSDAVVRWRTEDEGDGVGVVEIANPPMNALSRAVAEGLTRVLDELEGGARPDVRALVVVGEGRAFSAGAEIAELADLADPERADAQVRRMHALFARLEALGLPTIAALDGPAVGGGLELALACDLRVAVARARLGLPEVTLGLIAGAGGTQRLPAVIGPAAARELVLTGRLVGAVEARALGLVHRVVDDGTARDAAIAWAAELAALPARALAAAKVALAAAGTDGGYDVEREAFGTAARTADAAEGIAAFLEKRPATFTHR